MTGAIVRSMKLLRSLVTVGIVCAVGFVGAAEGIAGAATLHDGIYGTRGIGPGYFQINLSVVGNGTKLGGGLRGSSFNCGAGPTLVAKDPTQIKTGQELYIKLPHAVPITPSGAFSFSGNVTLLGADSDSTMNFTFPISVSGHFYKGLVVLGKTVAVTGTFSAPGVCESIVPKHFSAIWQGVQ
jgi:hypothetical protein